MASASLEIHMINVSHGDSVMIINRDLGAVEDAINAHPGGALVVPPEEIDWVPYAVQQGVDLYGTVRYCLLVDAGDDFAGAEVLSELISNGVVKKTPDKKVIKNFYVMVSHLHDDHDQGLRQVFGKPVGVKVPLKVQKTTLGYVPERIYSSPRNHKRNPKSMNLPLFWAALDAVVTAGTKHIEVLEGGIAAPVAKKVHAIPKLPMSTTKKPITFELGKGAEDDAGTEIPIVVKLLAAGAAVYEPLGLPGNGTIQPVPSKVKKSKKKKGTGGPNKPEWDENDRSLVFVLEYGSFRYFHGGDIAGDGGTVGGNTDPKAIMGTGSSHASTQHGDVESVLAPRMPLMLPAQTAWTAGVDRHGPAGHCQVMKASHHASASSVDTFFLATVKPNIVLMSTGTKIKHHGHPTPQVMFRCDVDDNPTWNVKGGGTTPNTIDTVYVTEITDTYPVTSKKTKKKKAVTFDMEVTDDTKLIGDIVLRPTDESIVQMRAATTKETLEIQVYGSGVKTKFLTTHSSVRDHEDSNAPGPNQYYVIGPYTHGL